ncbi:3'-5' exonuclease [Cognatishimia sp.]|uniref:3'-5' exonuclease n=1 Tax=Cognatishimia sp. TaxID=2211648 RepID=UPI003BAA4890
MANSNLTHLMSPLAKQSFRFVALDVETASREHGSICQIGLGCAAMDGSVQTWSCYVNPQTEFAPFNTELHGISANTVRDAPTFPQLWPVLAPFLAQYPLVQHSRFDEKAIAAACRLYQIPPPPWYWSDSVVIARKAWPELKGNGGHGLGNLKKVLGLSFHHHDAGEDARASAQVVLKAKEAMGVELGKLIPPLKPQQLAFDFKKQAG